MKSDKKRYLIFGVAMMITSMMIVVAMWMGNFGGLKVVSASTDIQSTPASS